MVYNTKAELANNAKKANILVSVGKEKRKITRLCVKKRGSMHFIATFTNMLT